MKNREERTRSSERPRSDEARTILLHVLSQYRYSHYVPTIVLRASDFYLKSHPGDTEVRELRRELEEPDRTLRLRGWKESGQ